jgi:hypothetical protein
MMPFTEYRIQMNKFTGWDLDLELLMGDHVDKVG